MTFNAMDYWHWWIIGTVLFILEMIVPVSFFMWIGLGAILTGIINLIMLLIHQSFSVEAQGLLFAVSSVISVFIGKNLLKKNLNKKATIILNRRGVHYIGRIITLTDAIHNGRGHTQIDDTLWSVRGPDCLAQTLVEIVGVDGSLLIVRPIIDGVYNKGLE